MSLVLAYDQFNGSTFTGGVANLAAGTTLLKARLAAYTSFPSEATPPSVVFAPPNTLLGISFVAHGTSVPLVSTSNWKTSTWYIAGPGELTAMSRWADWDAQSVSSNFFVHETFATFIELDTPVFQAAAFDLGISLNFEGGGFWPNTNPWVSYQFVGWFD